MALPMLTQWTCSVGEIVREFGFLDVSVVVPTIVAWQLFWPFGHGRRDGSRLVAMDWILIAKVA